LKYDNLLIFLNEKLDLNGLDLFSELKW